MTYILVILIISLLILLHETGHFVAAKLCGVRIATFSVGFGKKLWAFTKSGTEYRLSLIPLGGYVLPDIEDEHAFFAIPLHKRVLFTLGGPLANILLAAVLLSIINLLSSQWSLHAIVIAPFLQVWQIGVQFIQILPTMFTQPKQLSGIIGIVATGGQLIAADTSKALQLAVMLSMNLAVFNLLPLPPLDGGKLMLYGLEKLNRRLVKLHIPVTVAGWVLIMGLMLYATAGDLVRYVFHSGI